MRLFSFQRALTLFSSNQFAFFSQFVCELWSFDFRLKICWFQFSFGIVCATKANKYMVYWHDLHNLYRSSTPIKSIWLFGIKTSLKTCQPYICMQYARSYSSEQVDWEFSIIESAQFSIDMHRKFFEYMCGFNWLLMFTFVVVLTE